MEILDKLEFRTPIAMVTKDSLRTALGGEEVGLFFSSVWQTRLRSLWAYIQRGKPIREVTADATLNPSQMRSVLLATGTITLTLPAASIAGNSYYVFNYGSGVITIAGTINGNALGYQLTNQYQYAEFTSVDGLDWIVTLNN